MIWGYYPPLVAIDKNYASASAELTQASFQVMAVNRRRTRFFMLIIRDLKVTLGGRTLFEDATLQVSYGDRVALIGPTVPVKPRRSPSFS
jgi:hypothetical protein